MIPKLLKITGLYSYKDFEETVIDFEQLSQVGLFGIFGATGSGKSTIPEAMLLALYDETIRFEGRSSDYDLMNLDSNYLKIEFDFENEGLRYRRVVEGSRNLKNRAVKIEKPLTYVLEKGEWIPLSKNTGKELLGLNIAEFTKTVIIPQDKFRAFIELKDAKRIEMLSELFDLKKYDLRKRTTTLEAQNRTAITATEAELKGIGEADEAMIAQMQTELSATRVQLEEVTKSSAAFDELKRLFNESQNYQNAIQVEQSKITDFSSKIIENQAFINDNESAFETLKKEYESRQELKNKAQDLRNISKIIAWQKELLEKENRIAQGGKLIEEEEKLYKSLENIRAEKEKNYNNLSSEKPDFEQIRKVREWFSQLDFLNNELKRIEDDKAKIAARVEVNQAQSKRIYVNLGQLVADSPFFDKPSEAILYIKKTAETWSKRQNQLEELAVKLKTSEKLKAFAESLVEGEPCPLCGATHHPSVWTPENVEQELAQAESERSELRKKIDTLSNIEKELVTVQKGLTDALQDEKEQDKKLKDNVLNIENWHKQFVWQPLFSPDERHEFEKVELEATQFNQRLEQAFEALKKAGAELKLQEDKLQKYTQRITILSNEKAEINAHIKATISNLLTIKTIDDYVQSDATQLETEAQSLDNQYFTITDKFENLNKKLEEKRNSIALLRGQHLAAETQLAQLSAQLDLVKKQLNERVYESALHDLTVKKRDEIQFRLGALQNRLEITRIKLQKRAELHEKLEKLKEREDYLSTLNGLFRGDGFTGYVANVFLKNICEAANVWFLRFTKHGLRLETDENNRLQVRDILNRGLLRSIDTLSGGQKFQASLALALALSDNIQGKSGATQRFFFLDEGFGSLDRESLRIVFDTLHMLREKGRIVGVISHVEEMQQEISVYLKVRLDAEKGSVVEHF